MAILKPTEIYGAVTGLFVNPNREAGLQSKAVDAVTVNYAGFEDEAHGGLTRPSCTRVKLQYPRGTEIRNTRQIVEAAFNTLYGTFAADKANVPTKAFGDVGTLADKGLLQRVDDYWKVNFAKRAGLPAKATLVESQAAENALVLERLSWLIKEQDVRVEDILILSYTKKRIENLARFLEQSNNDWLPDLHVAFKEKDEIIGQRKRLTLSTVASA